MAAVDLSTMQDLNATVNALTLAVAETDQAMVAQARAYSQSYTGIFGDAYPPSFIDLEHFLDLVVEDRRRPGGDSGRRAGEEHAGPQRGR